MTELALISTNSRALSANTNQRTIPSNTEAEQALLGALLVNNSVYEKVGETLSGRHFFDPVHGRIYDAIATLIDRGQIADTKTLKGLFDNDPALTELGGSNYLVMLAANVVSIFNVEDYANLIHELYLRRQLIGIGTDVVNDAFSYDLEQKASTQIEEAEAKLFDLAETGDTSRGFLSLKEAVKLSIETANEAYKRDSHITGVTTGLRDLDTKLGGLQKSDLIIVAGRPGMGKTALATNIAFNAARAFVQTNGKEGAGVAFFSLEMSSEQLATRLLGERARFSSDKIRRGAFKAQDFRKFVEASKELSSIPLYIDDTPALSVAGLRTRVRRLKRTEPNLGLVVVDYLQLLQGSLAKSKENRVQEVSEITRGLKGIAKELNIPVLAASQLSRAVEQREDKTPQLADLRESGSIEQDADIVMFIYREEYYNNKEPSHKPGETEEAYEKRYQHWQHTCEKIRNIATVIVAKQRHGPIGEVDLHFDGEFTKFSNLERE